MAIQRSRKATDTATGWTAEDIHGKIGGSLDAIKAALATFGPISSDDELATFQMALGGQPTAQPQPQAQAKTAPQTNSKLTVEAFTGAVTNDVASAKAEIARVRQAAEGELMSYAKEQIAIYQGFKEALPAAMAGFLSSAAWEPAVLTFDVSAEPVHQLTAGA